MITKDDIISLPNESLRRVSAKVTHIDDSIFKIIEGMKEATLDWEASRSHEVGVALAAVQINELLRIVVFRNNTEDKNDQTFSTLINPEITKKEGAVVDDFEGCLSVPEIYGRIPRYEKVRVKAIDTNGKELRIKATGFLARTLQHEIDHTNGIVIIDHIKNRPDAFFHLTDGGELQPLNYEKQVRDNPTLWG